MECFLKESTRVFFLLYRVSTDRVGGKEICFLLSQNTGLCGNAIVTMIEIVSFSLWRQRRDYLLDDGKDL